LMFNAAFTVQTDAENTIEALKTILEEKGFLVEGPGTDKAGTLHLKAVNKSRFAMLKYVLKLGHDEDIEAQRAGVHAIAMQGEEKKAFLFFSVYPIMEFYHLPEIPNITESEEERKTDEMLCERILEDLCETIMETLPGSTENFRTLPMKKTYLLRDSHEYPREKVEEEIVDILKKHDFAGIKKNHSEYNTVVEIKARNKSFFRLAKEQVTSIGFSRYLGKAQSVGVRITIIKPELGVDHRMEVNVSLYPSMEFLSMEEIPMLSQEIDEELTDSLVCQEMWDSLIEKLDERFG
ncbi:MAG: hypothetical protein KAU14_08010, partial [Thermoplasmata archaeon]|nr:hypothetical protein [Thermoplasmata archaeon]